MIINPLTGQRVSDKKSTSKAKSSQGTSFFDLLADQLHSPEETHAVESTTALTTAGQIPTELRLTGLTVSENTIDLLESFSEALGNLNLPATDLLPLIEALEGEATTLLDIKEQLPAHDPLAQLIDRVTTIGLIEAAKFRRGDYQ